MLRYREDGRATRGAGRPRHRTAERGARPRVLATRASRSTRFGSVVTNKGESERVWCVYTMLSYGFPKLSRDLNPHTSAVRPRHLQHGLKLPAACEGADARHRGDAALVLCSAVAPRCKMRLQSE